MSVRAALRCGFLAVFLILSWLSPAHAWIETSVRGHRARIEVKSDGTATVRHELMLKLRGGPMTSLEIGGIGTDIEALPDASVKRATEGSSGMWPLSMSSMEDGALRLSIEAERGIRGGTYIFNFGYNVNLQQAELLEQDGGDVLVSWVGPRLSSGVDSAKVTFVVPRGQQAPVLVDNVGAANVLLGEVRRGAEWDEIDLVRAHLATGEPAVWQVRVSSDAFSSSISGATSKSTGGRAASGITRQVRGFATRSELVLRDWILAIGFGALLFFLQLAKSQAAVRAAAQVDARLLPLIPAPPLLRALLSSVLGAAYVLCTLGHRMWWALFAVGAALLIGTYLLPVRRVAPRGPGKWQQLSHQIRTGAQLPGRWFDTRSLSGLGLLLVLVGSLVALSYCVLSTSNYLALMCLSSIAFFVPLFWTGSRRDLPLCPEAQAMPWVSYLTRALDPALVSVELWGRSQLRLDRAADEQGSLPAESNATETVDEARVRLVLAAPPPGLRAFEITLEEAPGAHVMPCVLLRVLEDSPAIAALPRDLAWRRGRTQEERVALLRPAAPTFSQTLRLVRSLLATLTMAQRASRSRKSVGRSDEMEKGVTSGAAQLM